MKNNTHEMSELNLKNKKLSAVVFVLDYLQLQFDEAILTFREFPKVESGNRIISSEYIEYRNKICSLIGKEVSAVEYVEDDFFRLLFDDAKICCSINPQDYTSPEMIIFDDGNGKTIVF
jgi:hypothetical protein